MTPHARRAMLRRLAISGLGGIMIGGSVGTLGGSVVWTLALCAAWAAIVAATDAFGLARIGASKE